MPLLLSSHSVEKSYGSVTLFKNLAFSISDGDRIGLIGPNGSGKSTLLQILARLTESDSGTVSIRKLVRVAYVAQEDSFPAGKTIQQIMEETPLDETLSDMELAARISTTLGRAGFLDAEVQADSLSGGWKKRLSIARELLKKPDLLLLDEPTNHLDLESIFWLEKLLNNAQFAWLAVSHDRYFLENTAQTMMELDCAYPEGLFTVNGSYSDFLIKKEEFLAAQSKHQEALENKVRREVEWLRRGAKARTTKSKARISTAGELIQELGEVTARGVKRTTQIDFAGTDRQTKRLVDVIGISKAMGGGRELFRDFSFVLSPGARIGLLGPNGSGKTTLLRLITGELQPDAGTIKRADAVKMVYFDQGRELLDPEMPLRRALASHGDSVIFRDRSIHVAAWASRFLFRSEQLDLPLSRLSGGEQARVLIARMMLEPADVLLLDEPTNDLDIRTLEVLEESLMDFPGALVLVTHDRYMLERVSTLILGLNAEGGGAAIFADCSQWEREQELRRIDQQDKKKSAPTRQEPPTTKKKLSYMESREWEQIEQTIADAEKNLQLAQLELHAPDTVSDSTKLLECYEKVNSAQRIVDELYARWEELSSKLETLAPKLM